MKKLVLSCSILLLILSCKQESPESAFQKDGVSLKVPKGWQITEEDPLDDLGYFISIEKDGFDSSGVMTISWVNDSLGLKDFVEIQQGEMRDITVYKNADLKFEPIGEGKFNDEVSSYCNFTMNLLGVAHSGKIQTFYGNGKTFLFLRQEADEDTPKNAAGFEAIEKSFSSE